MIEMCNENSRIEGDPECSSDVEIDEWMENKIFAITAIEQKVDFTSFKSDSNLMKKFKTITSLPLNRK